MNKMNLYSNILKLNKYKYLAIFLLSVIALILTLQGMSYSADTLFPFRYANLILSNEPYEIMVQPAPRFFPDVLYAALSIFISNNTLDQIKIVALINISILCTSVLYLFSILFKKSQLTFIYSGFFCLLVPLLYLLQFGSLRANLFATGVHGFAIPFQLFLIALSIKLIQDESMSKWGWLLYFLIGSICGINDSLFLVSTILPVCFAYTIIWIVKKNNITNISNLMFLLCNLFIVFVTLFSNKILNNLFENMYFMSTTTEYFNTNFMTWLNGKAKVFLDQFFNLKKTQGASYLVLISMLTSLICIVRIKKRDLDKTSITILFLNIINITWLPIALFSMWAIDKGLVRYIPYILLISPVIIIVNLYKFIQSYQNIVLILQLIIIFLFGFHFINEHHKYHYKSPESPNNYHQLMGKLSELKKHGIISENGLSDYWVAWSSTQEFGFNIISIDDTGNPFVFVSDALAYWNKENGVLKKKKFTFVISKSKKGKIWTIDEDELIKNYGNYNKVIPFNVKKKKFLIYVYSNGINSDYLYNGANQIRDNYFNRL